MRVDFYHLTRHPLDRVLPMLAEKTVAGGERMVIVAEEAALRERLDSALWSYRAESFLPHGVAGEGADAVQPVLIAADVTDANGARSIALADSVWRDSALSFDRIFFLFDESSIVPARDAWRNLAGKEELERHYWRQGERGWEQVA